VISHVAMTASAGRRWLQGVLAVGGAVAIATGAFGVVTGVDGLPGDTAGSASAESELRFLYVFWIAYGIALILVAPRVDAETLAVRALAAILFAAGLARAIAWLDAGRPAALFVVLMVVELVLPPVIVAWQARIAAASPPGRAVT
jgi:uncharacterized protein DUF4345